jgi:hypothetical protein
MRQGYTTAKASGTQPGTSVGQGTLGVEKYTPPAQNEAPAISNFFNPENPLIQDSTAQLMEWLNPEADRVMLNDHIKQLSADRAELGSMKTELMSMNRIMDGSAEDIAKEIESSGGLATSSQVAALAVGRNNVLLKKAQLISDQIQSQTDLVNSDISLIGEEKQMAATQFTQRMSLLNYQQQNNDRMFNAFKDGVSEIQKTAGWAGVLAAYQDNPRQMAYVDSLYGGAGSVQRLAALPQPGDLQFISGTENQPSGVFDKATGTFTPVGGGSGSGGTGTNQDAQSWVTNIQNKTATLGDVPAKLKTEVSNILAAQPKQMGASAVNMTSIINGLVDNPNLKFATGFTGALPSFMTYGSDAYNIKKQADQVKNMLSLENRQSLKGQGQISDFEGRMLASAATTLSSGLTPQAYEQELRKIRGFVQVMNGNPIEVRIINPKTGEFQFTQVDEAGLEQAINDGAVIEYQ